MHPNQFLPKKIERSQLKPRKQHVVECPTFEVRASCPEHLTKQAKQFTKLPYLDSKLNGIKHTSMSTRTIKSLSRKSILGRNYGKSGYSSNQDTNDLNILTLHKQTKDTTKIIEEHNREPNLSEWTNIWMQRKHKKQVKRQIILNMYRTLPEDKKKAFAIKHKLNIVEE